MGISTKMLKHILVVAAIMLHVVASQPLDINVEVTVNGVKIPISQNPIAEASSGSSSGTKAGAFTLWPANQTSPQAGAKAGAFTLWPGKAGAKAGAFTLWPEDGSGSGPGIFRKPWHDNPNN